MDYDQGPRWLDAITPVPTGAALTNVDIYEARAILCDYIRRCSEAEIIRLLGQVASGPETQLVLKDVEFLFRDVR